MPGSFPGSRSTLARRTWRVIRGRRSPKGWTDCVNVSAQYAQRGARFAKWRAVIVLGDGIPSRACIGANAQALARYAALCEEAGLSRSSNPRCCGWRSHLGRCAETTEDVLRTVFDQLYDQGVTLEGMLLKPNMVLPGLACPAQATVDEVADATVNVLLRAVPAAVPGIAFLSGGQPGELASARLNAMNVRSEPATRALAVGVLVCPRHPATGPGDLARRGRRTHGGPASPVPSSPLQPRCAPR